MSDQTYIIVTPAYNESLCIEWMIESVIAQSVRPLLWVIVDDGSTDQTAAIIKEYAQKHPWIHYAYRPKEFSQTYYASNVYAIQHGLETIQNSEFKTQNYDYLAILDADISLPADYYASILARMQSDRKLGIASGVYMDRLGENSYRKVLNDRRSTPKALMVFRRECYEQIGGFIPMKYGGEDTVACFTARMKGWKTWSFPDIVAIHNKPVGTGHAKGLLKIRFRQGIGEYFLATHPLFMLLKSARRCLKEPPYCIGGLLRLVGFIYAYCMRERRQLSDGLVRFTRKEQIARVFKGNRIPSKYEISRMSICLVASAGGHLSQLLTLAPVWQEREVIFVSTGQMVLEKLVKLGTTYIVDECNRQHPFKTLAVMFRCLKIVRNEHPDVILSTGAAAGFLMCFWGKLFGAKIIWLDSIANAEKLSMSGRMICPFADLILSQWPAVAAKYPKVEYVGEVI